MSRPRRLAQNNDAGAPTDLVILATDEADARYRRRYTFFEGAGMRVLPMAFTREEQGGVKVVAESVSLGMTSRQAYAQRVLALAGALRVVWAQRQDFRSASWIYSISLDNTLLGLAARMLTRSQASQVMELSDVQPVMVQPGPVGATFRAVERFALRHIHVVVTTSTGFERDYLPAQGWTGRTVLLENTVFPVPEDSDEGVSVPPVGPPWRIGWFGALRCQESWELLRRLVRSYPGDVELVLAGYPNMAENERFLDEVAETSSTSFLGRYDYPDELSSLYGQVHFNWCVDRSAVGGNSSWLLPNRLYEGGLFGVPALAERGTEAGRWVDAHGSGLVLSAERTLDDLTGLISSMTTEQWLLLREAVREVPAEIWSGEGQRRELLAAMTHDGAF